MAGKLKSLQEIKSSAMVVTVLPGLSSYQIEELGQAISVLDRYRGARAYPDRASDVLAHHSEVAVLAAAAILLAKYREEREVKLVEAKLG